MKIILNILAIVSIIACTTQAFSPLQIERERGFLSSHSSKHKSNLEKTFTKARLPVSVHPLSYELEISPILDDGIPSFTKWTAPGSVRILVNVTAATNVITLNSVGITIDDPSITVSIRTLSVKHVVK